MTRAQAYAAIALAGALGAVARDLLNRALTRRLAHARLPVGILVVNVAGSLGLGLVVGARALLGGEAVLLAGVGFLGAFTTFSTFAVQAVRLPRADGLRYVLTTVASCAAAAGAGLALASAAV